MDEELLAAATVAVVAGAEDEAIALLARVPDRGVFFPPLDGTALLYVLRPELRPRYDALDLEGTHAQRRAFAAAFVAAREGDLEPQRRYPWPRDAVVRWFAPAPWLVEAAVYSAASGGNPPPELMERLGPSQRHVLRALAASPACAVATTAARFVATLPRAAPDPLTVRVLGSLEVDVAGVRSGAPELRRERVRSLLGLLVVRRSVRRVEAADILWPDLGSDQALGNLRVTLTHLLRLIEPRREKNAPSFFIHQENDSLTLHDDPALRVDLWEFEAAAAEAEELDRSGAPSLALEAHIHAVELWRGDLLADLASPEWLDFDRIRLGTMFLRAALRAGELLAARHEHGHAVVMAERAIAADPWAEAAYRLLASIQLERGDRSAARRVLEHLDSVLGQLGVQPGPETAALRQRCLESG
jgi:DNA-binding SARP family transcriptional activator